MVLQYNTEQAAIEARQRIATAEGLPKMPYGETYFHLNYTMVNGGCYIDARENESKDWYANELLNCSESLSELPIVVDNPFYGYALIATESIMQTYPELPYETDANGTTVLKWDIVYDDAYNYALPTILTLEKIKYKPIL